MKPSGVPARDLEKILLTIDEYEAIRLADDEGLDHQSAADALGVSRPTFSRLIEQARHKVAQAIVGVKELVIEGGHFNFQTHLMRCGDCGEFIRIDIPENHPDNCSYCHSQNLENWNESFMHGRGKGFGKGHGGHGHGNGRNR